MALPELLVLAAATIAVYMLGFWLVSLALRDVSIVDIGWGLGFVVVSWVCLLASGTFNPPALLLVILCTVWGLRLSGYLAWRNHGEPEDRRYAAMREKHGDNFWWISLFTVFGLQGVVMWVVSLPLVVGIATASSSPQASLHVWQLLGILVWLVGIVFEAGGDWQLARFKAQPNSEGEVCDRGLWRYTRHPNYFGDFCVWWGHWLVSLSSLATAWTVVSPIVMSAFLMKFSGVGMLESDITDRRPEYAEYQRRTNAFFPWWPQQ